MLQFIVISIIGSALCCQRAYLIGNIAPKIFAGQKKVLAVENSFIKEAIKIRHYFFVSRQ